MSRIYFHILLNFPIILGRLIVSIFKDGKSKIRKTYLAGSYGIVGTTNAIIYEGQHILFSIITLGEEKSISLNSPFIFTNPPDIQSINITHYAFNKRFSKSLFPVLHLVSKKANNLVLVKNHFKIQPKEICCIKKEPILKNQQIFRSVFHPSPKVKLRKVPEIPITSMSKIEQEIYQINKTENLTPLINQLQTYGKLLPDSGTRSYHETLVEGSRFGQLHSS